MRNVFQSTLLADAAIVRDLLAEHGIEAQLVEGQSPYPGTAVSEVWVLRDEDRPRARELVARMKGSDSDTGREWRCRECRETNPGTFDVCWSCGAASPR